MTTYQIMQFFSDFDESGEISAGRRSYLHARAKNSFYQYIVTKFLDKEAAGEITKADLARRIGKRPEVITRLLRSSGNWTIETIVDLLAGISGEELMPKSEPFRGRAKRNYTKPE